MSKWQHEGFERPRLTVENIDTVLDMIRARISRHFEEYGDGMFLHPHELVGCMCGQQTKLSASADESIYHGKLGEFEERCTKTLLAMVIGTASVQKMEELKARPKPTT